MLDCGLFGFRPGLHHLTNLLLHAANALLFCALLSRLTSAPIRSAIVAALFALHPLHVESVAWIAERKPSPLQSQVGNQTSRQKCRNDFFCTAAGTVPPLA